MRSRKAINLRNIFLSLLASTSSTIALLLILSCAHVTNSSESNSSLESQSAASKAQLPPGVVLPAWTGEDCVKKDGFYFFVGYGEGTNSSSAARNALLASRQNALACLFGGTITSTISIKENNSNASYQSSTILSLDYSHVNWAGYDVVSGQTFFIDPAHSRIYTQYKWPEADIAKEKIRLDSLANKIEETNAMKGEIALKEVVISEQRARLGELQKQEEELRAIKEASDRAVVKLKDLRNARNSKQNDMMKMIPHLYCGVTIQQFIDLYRDPDKIEFSKSSGYFYRVRFYWDQYLIEAVLKESRRPDEEDLAIRDAKSEIIESVFIDYGKTERGYKICGK